MEKITWDWLGGFFDGEGYCAFRLRARTKYQREHGKKYPATEVVITQMEKEIIEKIAEFLGKEIGGKPRVVKGGTFGWAVKYRAIKDVYRFLEKIKPHLRTKRKIEQVEKTLKAIENYYDTHYEKAVKFHPKFEYK